MMNNGFQEFNKKSVHTYERGNAMVYILIALALFGFLTVTLSRQNQQSDSRNLSKENIDLYVNEIIEYTAAAQQAVDKMLITGTEISELDFIKPGESGFDTPPHIHKVYHARGGGLNYKAKPSSAIQNGAASVWDVNTNINVEWTPSTQTDPILTAYHIDRRICERMAEKITGATTIPVTNNTHDEYFLNTGTRDFDVTECSDCDGYPTLCVENPTGDNYSYYYILSAR
jgi:type II secretory pathway pseudopilin PulG